MKSSILAATVLLAVTQPVFATTWQLPADQQGDILDGANWTEGLPTPSNNLYINAYIDNGGTAVLSYGLWNSLGLYLGTDADGSGYVTQTGGQMALAASIGRTSTAMFAGHESSFGLYEQQGGTFSVTHENVGYRGVGEVRLSGGTRTVTGTIFVGHKSTGSGSYYLSDNGVLYCGSLAVGMYGSGTFTQTGGELIADRVGISNAGDGLFTITSGSFEANELWVGNYGAGTFHVGGPDPVISVDTFAGGDEGTLEFAITPEGVATIQVNGTSTIGGTLQVFDASAPLGRFDLMAANDITGEFQSVALPDASWSWGTSNGTVWVQHVPEPSTFCLLAVSTIVALGHVGRRWKRRVPPHGLSSSGTPVPASHR